MSKSHEKSSASNPEPVQRAAEKPVSLKPLDFETAMKELLKVKPEKKRDARKAAQGERG